MTWHLPASLLRVFAVVFAAIPFAFGMIRAITTGADVRYVWVALAGMCGGMMATAVARGYRGALYLPALTAGVFVTSGVLAVFAALLLGTRLGPGILVVAASFASCFAASSLSSALARRDRSRGRLTDSTASRPGGYGRP
jgi:hypothetical protein